VLLSRHHQKSKNKYFRHLATLLDVRDNSTANGQPRHAY
jgi:hypothetical protein